VKALLSVYDKTGVVELAKALHDLGCDLVSSGGTAKVIAEAGLPVTDTAELTGFPAILGHRVVTLHPKVHGGILADPTDDAHRADMAEHGIEPFDLVVINAYPFGSDPADFAHGGSAGSAGGGATAMDVLDIGGPAMIRAAAKNHAHVGIVTDPADYDEVLDELRAAAAGEGAPGQGSALSDGLRRRLARKAFAFTAAYDAAIVAWFDEQEQEPRPASLHLTYRREPVELRYGENPHQAAALYRSAGADPWWAHVEVHGGMALSYLNLFDADAAWLLAHDLRRATGKSAVAIIKHANPCGAAVADSLGDAYQWAFECDPRSAFGGIVALSDPVDESTVEAMVAAAQADLVIAPGYAPGAIDALLAKRKNTRVLQAPPPVPDARHLRPITGGLLVQDPHRFVAQRADWRVVTQRQPTEAEWADAELAWRVCGHVKSNAIVLAKDGVAWGIGAGQQNRVESGELAAKKADGRAAGGACASDAFYPFPDGIEAAAAAGVAVIVQPGGSVKDEVNIARADELGVAMVFTGERHFLH
jgi:phosphoribosylaminoimidazolecarboxamide formyltransferase / IMP cyclohydrolase